jgi:predicted glycosyltransferase
MKNPKVLVCPLDWGLGHATRCIPIIRHLKESGAEVIIASDGPQLTLLREEFPDLEYILLPGYKMTYNRFVPIAFKVLTEVPRLFLKITRENKLLKSIIKEKDIDVVISDNRYGLWNKNVYSVLITHQVNIIVPPTLKIAGQWLHSLTHKYIRRFDECWIPDFEGKQNLSGDLSHGTNIPSNCKYIGILSRFDRSATISSPERRYEIIAIVSGPETQRTTFEEKLLAQLPVNDKSCLLIRGIPGNTKIKTLRRSLDVADHLTSDELEGILRSGPMVICRAGYSTLMDIAFSGNKAILVPTPGQTEQEYLAANLSKAGIFYTTSQKRMNLPDAFSKASLLSGIQLSNEKTGYKTVLNELLNKFRQ